MEREFKEDLNHKLARERLKAIKGFYLHLTTFVFVVSFILLLNTQHISIIELFEKADIYVIMNFALWGIGVFVHWVIVFGAALVFGTDWEHRKMRELMEKEKQE